MQIEWYRGARCSPRLNAKPLRRGYFILPPERLKKVPAAALATSHGLDALANMILSGFMIAQTGVIPSDMVEKALSKVVFARHADLLGKNLEAVSLGYQYKQEER